MHCCRASPARARSSSRRTHPQGGIRDYDLASQERIVRGRMPTMEIINERFARNIRIGLFNLIRKSPEVAIGGIKVQKFSAFLREIVVPTNFNIVAVKPLRGSGLIVCDPSLVFAVIDALFGGIGKFHTRIEGRDFSPTEQRVILRLVETIMHRVPQGLDGHLPAGAGVPALGDAAAVRQHRHAQRDRGGDQLHAGNRRDHGTVHFCIPYSTLEPIRDVLYSTIQGDANEPDRRWVNLLKQQIQSAEVDLVAELAHAPATVEQLLAFKPGDFIELDLEPDDPGQGRRRAGVRLPLRHQSNGRYAIKIEQC
jgi:flagellar motor switch protein FliM